jgi:hypothetical protein
MIDFPELVSDRTTRVEVRVGEEAQPSVRSIPTAPIRASMLLSGIKGGRRNRFARQPLRRRGDGRLIRLWFSGLPIAAFPVFGHKVSPLRLIDRRGRRKIKGPATCIRRGAPRSKLCRSLAKPPAHRRSTSSGDAGRRWALYVRGYSRKRPGRDAAAPTFEIAPLLRIFKVWRRSYFARNQVNR